MNPTEALRGLIERIDAIAVEPDTVNNEEAWDQLLASEELENAREVCADTD